MSHNFEVDSDSACKGSEEHLQTRQFLGIVPSAVNLCMFMV